MGQYGMLSVDDFGIIPALVEHTHIQVQHVGYIDSALHAALIGADDQHMLSVDPKIRHIAQQALDELIDRLDGIKAVQGDGVLNAGIVGVKGNDIIYAHPDQLLQGDGAVQGFTLAAGLLAAFIKVGHDNGDPPGLAAGGRDHALEIGVMIVRRHMVLQTEHFVGLAEVDHIYKDIEVHTADRLGKDAFAFAGTETRQVAVHDIAGTLIIVESGIMSVLALAFRSPAGQVIVNLFSHFLTAYYRDDPQSAVRHAFKISFVMFPDGFHSLSSLS